MSIEHIHFEIFAANLDWLEVCLPMLFVGFWIVSQAVAIFRKIAGAGMEKPAGRINMPVPAKGERVFVDGQVDISRQIEDFLSQRIESAKTQSPPVLRSPASPRQEQNRSLVVKKTPRPSQRKGTAKPPALPAKSASEKLPLSDSVQPVNAMDSGTTDVGRHVSEIFSHKLSHLSHLQGTLSQGSQLENQEGSPLSNVPGVHIAAMLRNPATIRSIVALREILDRPVHRW
ncbi:MAG: hypothetical protein WCR23_09215 [Planctomycetota bacterium]